MKNYYTPASELQIIRNYGNEVSARAGKVLFDGNKQSYRAVTLKYRKNGANIWVEVLPWNGGEIYDLTVVVEGAMKQEVKGKH